MKLQDMGCLKITILMEILCMEPKFQDQGIGTKLYMTRKELARKFNLKRMVVGGRLYNYYKHADKMTPQEYVQKVIDGELADPVLSFQLKNGFKFIKVLPDYLYDRHSVNYASFLEWVNPEYKSHR